MEESITKFVSLLEKANQISFSKKRSKNFFEVSGYPHYENVASSILAFFFDTNEEHGLKDLWLKSLMECYSSNFDNEEFQSILSLNSYETVENGITREEATPELKRLDIVIPTNNDFVVAIENKIYADIYNPFAHYNEWINAQYSQYPNKLEVVLSLKPFSNKEPLSGIDRRGSHYHFINITYDELISTVRNNIGDYLVDANEKWLIFMNEFIKNIDSLQEAKMALNKDWQLFLEENRTLISEYNRKIQEDNKAKSELVKRMAEKLQKRIDNEVTHLPTRAYTYGVQSFAPHISLVIDITVDDGTTVCIEPYFKKLSGTFEEYQHMGIFYVTIWVREKEKRSSYLDWVEETLDGNIEDSDSHIIRRKYKDWGECIELKQFDFSKDIDEEALEDFIYSIWQVIAI